MVYVRLNERETSVQSRYWNVLLLEGVGMYLGRMGFKQ